MNLKNVFIFLCGVGLGAGSTYFILKDKYEQQANAEAEELKRYYEDLYSNKEETPSEKVVDNDIKGNIEVSEEGDISFIPNKEEKEPDYDDIIDKLNYNKFSTQVPDQYGEPRPAKKPYIIDEDDYNTDTRQIKKIISYFEDDGVCLDNDTKEVLDNVPKDLGMDNIEKINEEGFEELYIRNEVTGIDYNVVSEPGSYEDYLDAGDE